MKIIHLVSREDDSPTPLSATEKASCGKTIAVSEEISRARDGSAQPILIHKAECTRNLCLDCLDSFYMNPAPPLLIAFQ